MQYLHGGVEQKWGDICDCWFDGVDMVGLMVWMWLMLWFDGVGMAGVSCLRVWIWGSCLRAWLELGCGGLWL